MARTCAASDAAWRNHRGQNDPEVQEIQLQRNLPGSCRDGAYWDRAGTYRHSSAYVRRRIYCGAGGRCAPGTNQYTTAEYVSLRVSSNIDFHRVLYLLDHHDCSFARGGILFLDLVSHPVYYSDNGERCNAAMYVRQQKE